MEPLSIIISILLTFVGIVVGYLIRKTIAEKKISSAEQLAKQIVEEGNKNAEVAKKRGFIRGKR